LIVLPKVVKEIVDHCCGQRGKVRRHSLEVIVKNNMKLGCSVAGGGIVNKDYVTAVGQRVANINTKPSTRVPL